MSSSEIGPSSFGRSERERLPTRRAADHRRLRIGGHTIHVSIGLYQDGRPAEVFASLHKLGGPLRMFTHALAIAISIGLQHGVPASAFARALAGTHGGPEGDVEGDECDPGEEPIVEATSIPDLLVRMLARAAAAGERRRAGCSERSDAG